MEDEESASVTMDGNTGNGVVAKDRNRKRKPGSAVGATVATTTSKSGTSKSHEDYYESHASTMTPQRVTPEQSLAALNDASSASGSRQRSEDDNDAYRQPAKPKRTPISLFSKGNDDDDDENDPRLPVWTHESKSNKRPRPYAADVASLQFTQDSFETAESESEHCLQEPSVEESSEPALLFSQATLPIDYTPMSQTREENSETFFLMDCLTKKTRPLIDGLGVTVSRNNVTNGQDDVVDDKYTEFTIGRDVSSNLIVLTHPSIGNRHAKLVYDCTTHAWTLAAIHNTCWILDSDSGKWMGVLPVPGSPCSQPKPLPIHATFRLVAPSKSSKGKQLQNVQFTLGRCLRNGNPLGLARAAGSLSLDDEYLELLRKIETTGHMQTNKKGPSKTLREPHTLVIDLYADNFTTNLLPITTLRKMYGGKMAIYEALWYIRGENHVEFLQQHNCKFWDAQADCNSFVGLSYGLLTNFPDNGTGSRNQLLEKVIEPLCRGECSRNMNITLCKPGERTVQEACTSGLHFSVGVGDLLDLTVFQRSSDVILGLPNDVIVWSVILHLVRRDVWLRSGRKLKAGKLHFSIAAGGAHVYALNQSCCAQLLRRQPFDGQQPHMRIDVDDDTNLFALAQNYKQGQLRVEGYTEYHAAMKICQAL
jgi:thymidylate synthase